LGSEELGERRRAGRVGQLVCPALRVALKNLLWGAFKKVGASFVRTLETKQPLDSPRQTFVPTWPVTKPRADVKKGTSSNPPRTDRGGGGDLRETKTERQHSGKDRLLSKKKVRSSRRLKQRQQ